MFQALWWVPLAAGLQDGLNPCLLTNAALILIGSLWIKRAGINKSWLLLLISVMIMTSFFLNCGFQDKIILNKFFLIIVQGFYLLAAIFVGIKGIKFLNEWIRLVKGKEIKVAESVKLELSPVVLVLIVVVAGIVLSLMASLWPINYYVLVFSVYMQMPGQAVVFLGLMVLLYTVIALWFVYMVIWASTLETKNQRFFKIIAAAVLLSASFSVISILFMKG